MTRDNVPTWHLAFRLPARIRSVPLMNRPSLRPPEGSQTWLKCWVDVGSPRGYKREIEACMIIGLFFLLNYVNY